MFRARKNAKGQLEEILPDGTTRPLEGMTEADWARFDAITEEEAYQNALDDPDNPPLTPERLAKMRRIPNPIRLRERLGLTQKEFAAQFHISLGTVRDWETGVRRPDGTAKTYLRVIEKIPDAVRQALNEDANEPATVTSERHRTKTA
jgi:putative transcriptional regulator